MGMTSMIVKLFDVNSVIILLIKQTNGANVSFGVVSRKLRFSESISTMLLDLTPSALSKPEPRSSIMFRGLFPSCSGERKRLLDI
ncbi:hypothetical protein AXF42_Ash002703 [Apostasia shenzhenica]|uniref:Uncharacterized protein n=1 Tax=Apostasia shenzhenica TaxID=1088818 RepID=A0A2I0A715_9ASPA|nr:hypothetical protein AXF42_Ash002703 [Apostasia shenzhenica]